MKKLPIVLLGLAGAAILFGQTIPSGNSVSLSSISSSVTGNITGTVVSGNLVKGTGTTSIGDAATGTGVLAVLANTTNSTGGIVTADGAATLSAKVYLAKSPTVMVASDIDWSLNNRFSKTLSANVTVTFSNKANETVTVWLTNTASNYTVTWPTVSWSGGTPPVQTTGAHTDIYTFLYDGATVWGSVVQNF